MRRICGVLLIFILLSCSKRQVENITIKGSDTEVNLVLQLAEAYMDTDPAASISITGGGSGVGIAALLNHRTDIANSSRELSQPEMFMATQRGIHLSSYVFAADAIAILVHPAVGLDSLSLPDLGKIYAGEITDWQQVGGKPGGISLYGRQSNSGTFMYFREKVLGKDFSPALKQMNGTAQIIEAVKNDAGGIGYAGLGYVADPNGRPREGFKVLKISAKPGGKAFSPMNLEDIKAGFYPLTRPLFQFTDGLPTGKTLAFLEFEKSEAAKKIIEKNGYLPVAEAGLVQNFQK